jgi:hypothetical protein
VAVGLRVTKIAISVLRAHTIHTSHTASNRTGNDRVLQLSVVKEQYLFPAVAVVRTKRHNSLCLTQLVLQKFDTPRIGRRTQSCVTSHLSSMHYSAVPGLGELL